MPWVLQYAVAVQDQRGTSLSGRIDGIMLHRHYVLQYNHRGSGGGTTIVDLAGHASERCTCSFILRGDEPIRNDSRFQEMEVSGIRQHSRYPLPKRIVASHGATVDQPPGIHSPEPPVCVTRSVLAPLLLDLGGHHHSVAILGDAIQKLPACTRYRMFGLSRGARHVGIDHQAASALAGHYVPFRCSTASRYIPSAASSTSPKSSGQSPYAPS